MDIDHRAFRPLETSEWLVMDAGGSPTFAQNIVEVAPDDVVSAMAVHRDPRLWFSILDGLNWDTPSPFEAMSWIVRQDDCDLALATAIYSRCMGSRWCGPADGLRGMPQEIEPIVRAISKRESTDGRLRRRFRSRGYGYPSKTDPEALLTDGEACRSKLALGEYSVIEVPRRLLRDRPTEPMRPFEAYHVDETGASFVARDEPVRYGFF